MVNQNAENEVYHDFKYWEDHSDDYREGHEGTLLPLWRFSSEKAKKKQDWHPAHPAVLAVGLYDGTVLVYDVRARTKKPIYQSTVRTNKHTDPVWEAGMEIHGPTGAPSQGDSVKLGGMAGLNWASFQLD
eukprot:Skav200471  [mRNA]  locus=scaffold5182:71716:74499:- [translate_table: standard]